MTSSLTTTIILLTNTALDDLGDGIAFIGVLGLVLINDSITGLVFTCADTEAVVSKSAEAAKVVVKTDKRGW